jgi:hypothetical protein
MTGFGGERNSSESGSGQRVYKWRAGEALDQGKGKGRRNVVTVERASGHYSSWWGSVKLKIKCFSQDHEEPGVLSPFWDHWMLCVLRCN